MKSHSKDQKWLYSDFNTEKQTRLKIPSQNRKDLQDQVAMIKQIMEKVFDKNASSAEKIRTLFRYEGITIISILTAYSMTISTIVLAIIDVF